MIPAVEGLLPEPYNGQLLTLLYRLAEWHALSKLRMHTDQTLKYLGKATTIIGQELRSFRDWTQAGFVCKELPRETAARSRRREKKVAKTDSRAVNPKKSLPVGLKPKGKIFNLGVYKLHALGDYVENIRLFGTTDSYSTQIVKFLFILIFVC
jgi:hypothetical protein